MRVNKESIARYLDYTLKHSLCWVDAEENINRLFYEFASLHGIGVAVEETESQTRYVFVKYPFEEHHEYELMSSRHECSCEMANYFLDKPCNRGVRSDHIRYILSHIEKILRLPHWEDYLTEKPKLDIPVNYTPTPMETINKIIDDIMRTSGLTPVVVGSAKPFDKVRMKMNAASMYPKHDDSLDAMVYTLASRGCGKSNWVSQKAMEYIENDVKITREVYKHMLNGIFGVPKRRSFPEIKDVIFNDPATIVIWGDGTKTVVKTQNGEKYDPEKGLAMAICKKTHGNDSGYYETFKKFLPKEEKKSVCLSENRSYAYEVDFVRELKGFTEEYCRLTCKADLSTGSYRISDGGKHEDYFVKHRNTISPLEMAKIKHDISKHFDI